MCICPAVHVASTVVPHLIVIGNICSNVGRGKPIEGNSLMMLMGMNSSGWSSAGSGGRIIPLNGSGWWSRCWDVPDSVGAAAVREWLLRRRRGG